ncbi:MAG: glycosyltransferase family 2 protein [Acidobacteriota bacterium]
MDLSIIIPTYNRASTLRATLDGLDVQETSVACEIIVVDDGSTDSTADITDSFRRKSKLPVSYYFQPNRKQGAARNLGARFAEGEWLLFLGDDIVPGPELLKQHLDKHREKPYYADGSPVPRVVIGYTAWPSEWKKTRFLEFIGEQGWQFGFSLIQDFDDVPFNFFYTSNLSMPRKLFQDSGGFDEDFTVYGWEDIELSLRLREMGIRIVFQPGAKAFHYHPTNLFSFAERQRQVGLSACCLLEKHPELGDFLGVNRMPCYSLRRRLQMALLFQACRLTEKTDWPDLSRYYPDLLSYWYLRGVLEGFSAKSSDFYRRELKRGK